MQNEELYAIATAELGLQIKENDSFITKEFLVQKVNELIINDFEKLVNILYRMDVSETKINALLKEFMQEDAAEIIVNLMLERAAQKIKSRQQFNQRDNNISDEEKW
jgi:hypothetical protein